MAGQRDHRAIYAARKARAIEAGYTGYGGRSGARGARAAGTPLPGDQTARVDRRQVIPLANGDLVTTTKRGKGLGVLVAQIRRADWLDIASVTVKGVRYDGLYSHGGWDASRFVDFMARHGGGAAGLLGVILDQLAAQYGLFEDDDYEPDDIGGIELVVT